MCNNLDFIMDSTQSNSPVSTSSILNLHFVNGRVVGRLAHVAICTNPLSIVTCRQRLPVPFWNVSIQLSVIYTAYEGLN